MKYSLTRDREHLVTENLGLVHNIIRQKGITLHSSDYDDMVSIGTIGLIKAAINFDATKNISFSTYASKCIINELLMQARKQNKFAYEISIDEPIEINDKSNDITIGDLIEDSKANFIDDIYIKDECAQVISVILNCLRGKNRLIAFYSIIEDITQLEIGQVLNLS